MTKKMIFEVVRRMGWKIRFSDDREIFGGGIVAVCNRPGKSVCVNKEADAQDQLIGVLSAVHDVRLLFELPNASWYGLHTLGDFRAYKHLDCKRIWADSFASREIRRFLEIVECTEAAIAEEVEELSE